MKCLVEAMHMLDAVSSPRFRNLLLQSNKYADWLLNWLWREYKIKPVVVGLAVQKHGYRRFTEDTDILISKADHDRLEQDGKIKFGQLKINPGVQIDVLCEGQDGNPHPDFVRDGNSYYPTLEGLVYLKMLAGRLRDHADIVELLKANGLTTVLHASIQAFLPEKARTLFDSLWEQAEKERSS
jgi:hypothetical protein